MSSSNSAALKSPDTGPEARAAARDVVRILLEVGAVLARPEDPFIFTSGRPSPVYVDIRRLIAFPRARARVMDLAVAHIGRAIGHESLDVIAGGETAGIPFAAWIAERMGLPMCYVRKQPKGFGRMAQIEGDVKEGARVLLVEDLATDGGSKLAFVKALRDAGAEVAHTLVVFHYGILPQSTASLAEIGVRLHGLATWWDVIETAERDGYFSAETAQAVRLFLQDPDGWARQRMPARPDSGPQS